MSAGLADYTPPMPKRTKEQAKLCIYLGANLTEAEVEQYTSQLLAGGIPCKQCNGEIPGYHCSHPEAGPFTRLVGKCTICDYWNDTPIT